MPGEVPVGAAPSAVPEATTQSGSAAKSARASKMASAVAGLAQIRAGQTPSDAPKLVVTPIDIDDAAPAAAPVKEKLNAEPAEAATPEAEPEVEDPKVSKGLAAIEKQAKKFREEQSRIREEMALERAELARMKAEISGKVASVDELKKLKPLDLLEKLGIENEDDYDVLARAAYAKTKAGKADPRTQAAAQESQEKRDLRETIKSLQDKIDALGGEFTKRDKAAESRAFVEQYIDQAVKAIPTDKPTLIAKLHEKSPQRARQMLYELGARMERENDNETPSHAEVIAEYERLRRAELEETGVDVDALLKPVKPASTLSKTLDVTSAGGTRPVTTATTRADKLAAVTAGLRKLQ